MKPAGVSEPHRRLTFHWPGRPQISLPLVGFLFLSVLAHALAFYIFQVVYPPVATISPTPVQLNLLTPSTPENQALLRWIEAEDPAASVLPHEIIPGNLYTLQYQQSFEEIHTAPKSPDENSRAIPFPPAMNSMELINSAQRTSSKTPAKTPSRPTELKFSGQLAGRKIVRQPPLNFDVPGLASREPVSFMVGVGADGKVLYTFFLGLEQDDKTKTIRKLAEDFLSGIEFSGAPQNGVAWGEATYFWGNDAPQTTSQP